MKEKIIEILKNVLETESIDENSSQENIEAWDSMHQLSLAFELESEFNISFEPEEIARMKSVNEIERIVAAKR